MAKALEYKMDANSDGNAIHPGFISRQINGLFENSSNHTMIGARLADWVKVPDSINQMSRAELISRNRGAGLKKADPDNEGQQIDMTQDECDAATIDFCTANNID